MLKKILIGVSIAAIAGVFGYGILNSNDKASESASAETSPSSAPTSLAECEKSTAVSHTPMTVSQPKNVLSVLPKTMTLETNCGEIEIELNQNAPITLTNLSTLANANYFNASLCHRLTTEGLFVLQCGDPTATGGGSPTGWSGYQDENLPDSINNNYPAGTVAMANSGPGTNGSQFFLVFKDTTLGANYTIWGRITEGLELINRIAEVGAYQAQGDQAVYSGDGTPLQTVEIISARAQ